MHLVGGITPVGHKSVRRIHLICVPKETYGKRNGRVSGRMSRAGILGLDDHRRRFASEGLLMELFYFVAELFYYLSARRSGVSLDLRNPRIVPTPLFSVHRLFLHLDIRRYRCLLFLTLQNLLSALSALTATKLASFARVVVFTLMISIHEWTTKLQRASTSDNRNISLSLLFHNGYSLPLV